MGGQTDVPLLLTTWRDRGLRLVAVVYYHVTYLFTYTFSYVGIMSVHDSVLITEVWVVFERDE